MKRLIGLILIGAMAASLLTGCSPASKNTSVTSETTKMAEARPQDDYYRFINEERLKNAKFDYGAGVAGSAFDSKLIDSQVETVIKDIASGSGYEPGSEEDIIKKAYDAFLAYDFKKEPIPSDLVAVINEVKNAKTVDELMKVDAKLYRDYGVCGILQVAVGDNFFEADEKALGFYQISSVSGVAFTDVREATNKLNPIVTTTTTYLMTLGYDAEKAGETGKQLANIALKLYGAADQSILDGKEALEYVTIHDKEEIEKIMSNIDLSEYLKTVGYDLSYCKKFLVYDKTQLKCLNSILTNENLEALKAWKIYDIYGTYMEVLAPHYADLSGYVVESYDEREDQAVKAVKSMFTSETDPIFVERYYKKDVDKALRSMCDEIREGYRKLISNANWLSEQTRNNLLKKLDNIVYVTGTNSRRHDNSVYANLNGNYYELLLKYFRIDTANQINSLKSHKDREAIGMAMQTMNACYSPTDNNITITVAITSEPFFSINADHYTNLGGLGSVIAHEMGHAFDSNCIVYDQDGAYNPKWIPEQDLNALKERNKKAVSYFEDNFVVFGVHHVNGEQTLGENYADLGGMECVTSLAKNKDDLKKIFENYALIWGRKKLDVKVVEQIAYDVHSPEILRVNAILSTLQCFYDLYDVKEGDGMYIAPEKRISRWY